MKRIASTLFLAAAFGAAYGQTAFPTGVTSYVYVGAAGPNASTEPLMLYVSTNVAGSNFTNATAVTGVTGKVNAFGLNKTDGLLYGLGFQQAAAVSGDLYRMGSDGVTQQVGVIPPPLVSGATLALINTTAGMTDGSDNYYFTAYTYTGNPFATPYSVSNFKFFIGVVPNVSALTSGTATVLTPTYHEINISDPDIQAAFQAFLDNFDYVNPGYSDGGIEDIAIHPTTGQIYSYMSFPNGSGSLSGRPVVLNPATWVASTVGSTVNTSPGLEIAGAYFSASGNYYVLFTDGSYTQVNLTTGAIGTLMPTNLPLQSGTLRGDLASNPTVAPLPLTLISFTGRATDRGNELQWQSGSEQNLKGYTLQRSIDGKTYETLVWLNAKGSNSGYSFVDPRLSAAAYYRFRAEDNDGKWQYSNVVYLSAAARGATTVYPTAVINNSIQISSPATRIQVRVTDITGSLIADGQYTSATGAYKLTMPAMTHGLYFVQVTGTDGQILAVQKIVVE